MQLFLEREFEMKVRGSNLVDKRGKIRKVNDDKWLTVNTEIVRQSVSEVLAVCDSMVLLDGRSGRSEYHIRGQRQLRPRLIDSSEE